jgi:hypothetical protein
MASTEYPNLWEQIKSDEREYFPEGVHGRHNIHSKRGLYIHAQRLGAILTGLESDFEATAGAQQPADAEFWRRRLDAYFYVLPPDYMYIGLGDTSLSIDVGPDGTHYRHGMPVPRWAHNEYIGVHRVAANSLESSDTRIAFYTTQPDTRETSPMVLTGDLRLLEHTHFNQAATYIPEGLNLMSPDSLVPPVAAEVRPYDLAG